MSASYETTEKTRHERIPNRGSHDRALIHSILDQSILGHVGVSINGQPRVIPMAILREGEFLYLHGSNASQLLKSLAAGAQACITVSILDAVVASRSGFHCAVDYRSVVLFAAGEAVEDFDEKNRILDGFVQHVIPGHKVRPSKAKEVNATTVVRFPLAEASAKVRDSGVGDFDEDKSIDAWAGVIPIAITAGAPRTSPDLPRPMDPPDYATRFSGWGPNAFPNGGS